MSKKNCQYKIDFHAVIDGRKYALGDLDIYDRGGNNRGPAVVVSRLYAEGEKRKQLIALMDKNRFKVNKDYAAWFQKYSECDTTENFWNYMQEIRKDYGNSNNWWNFGNFLGAAVNDAAKNLPEYVKLENDFQNWLKLRPGIVEAWNKFDTSRRASPNRYHFNSDKEREDFSKPLILNIENFVANRSDRRFREYLENDRPLKFKTGDVVQLKREYYAKKGKDPFRYNADLRHTVRLGVVAEQKFDGQYGNYGVGSRSVNIMWFATGEETQVMERCLKLVKDEDMDNATASV